LKILKIGNLELQIGYFGRKGVFVIDGVLSVGIQTMEGRGLT
jgi:hypothetical protein